MSLQPGAAVGVYRVRSRIGEGGMGEVYSARDTALNRDVAIKVLPEAVASDPDRLMRFRREAQALAALNHPNVAQVFGLEDAGGSPAIVMELVEGPTLADRLRGGPLPTDETLSVARQVALGLEAAHARGIVHRDLKPSNVKIRPDGTVKVLDFGLAKVSEPASWLDNGPEAPTVRSPAMLGDGSELAEPGRGVTAYGVILGTAAYMAPEQAKGRNVDERADVWALGCLLFEMLTGRRAFRGDHTSDVLAAILTSEPDWSALPALPPGMLVHLQRCLHKDPAQRIHDVADMRLALEGAFEVPASAVAVAAGAAPRATGPIAVAFVAGLVLAGIAAWIHALAEPPAPVTRFVYDLPAERALSGGLRPLIAVAPDGRAFAYATRGGLYLQPLDRLTPTRLTDSGVESPFFSPDGQEVGFWDGPPDGGGIYRVPVDGGPAAPIVKSTRPNGSISWLADGTILYATASQIVRVSASGGTPDPVIEVEDARDPQLLPNGDDVLFLTPSEIVVQSISAPDDRTVLPLQAEAVQYVPPGLLMYKQGDALYAAPFDASTRAIAGEARAVTQGVTWRTDGDAAQYAVSASGTLIHIVGNLDVRAVPVWVDRDGREDRLDVPSSSYYYVRISPDGTRVALDERNSRNDVRVVDLATGAPMTLPTGDSGGWYPVWQGSRHIAYYDLADADGVSVLAANGTGAPTRLLSGGYIPYYFTGDGRLVSRGSGIWLADLNGGTEPALLIAPANAEAFVSNAVGSPDGRWIAYESNEDGPIPQIYVRSFPRVDDEKVRVSTNGGVEPVWSPNGRELFYVETEERMTGGTLMSVTYEVDGRLFVNRAPVRVIDWPYRSPTVMRSYDISPDGQRFLAIKSIPMSEEDRPRIVVVLTWLDDWIRSASGR